MKSSALFWLFIIMILTVGTGPVLADSEKQEAVPILDENLVTATRTKRPVKELGVSTSLITKDEIEARQAIDALEVLRSVPGFSVTRTGGRGATTSLFPRGGENNFTKVLIDGVSVNAGGGDFDFSSLLTSNFERVEVVRGPQSALYGSDAIGGVINFITQSGDGDPSVRVSTANGQYLEGDHNYVGEHSVVFTAGNEQIGSSLSYARVDDNGFLDINHEYWNNTFSSRVDAYPTEDLNITFSGRMENSKYKFPTGDSGDKFSPLDPNQEQEKQDWVYSLRGQYQMLPWLEHSVLVGWNRKESDFDDPEDGEADPFGAFFTDTEENRYSVDYHFNINWPATETVRSIFTGGFEYYTEDFDQETKSIFFGFESESELDESRDNRGWYAQEQLSLFDRLHLTLGARLEDNSEFDQEFVPRASAAYDLKETGTVFRTAYGEGFKTPTFSEQFAQGFATGNPNLDPEESWSWEVGVDQVLWGNKLVVGATYFYQKFDDLIAFVNRPGPASDFDNIQEARSRGVELSVLCKPGFGFTLGANYTYLDTEVKDDGGQGGEGTVFEEGEDLLRRPDHTVAGFVDWVWQGFQVRLDGLYVDERDDLDFRDFPSERVTLDDYFIANLATSYKFDLNRPLINNLKLFAKVENLFSEDYEEVFGFSAPDSSYRIGITFEM